MFSLRKCGFSPRVLASYRPLGSLATPNDPHSGLSLEWLICGESTTKPATEANRLHMSSRGNNNVTTNKMVLYLY